MAQRLELPEQTVIDHTLRGAIGPALLVTGFAYGLAGAFHYLAGGVDRLVVAPAEAFSFVALSSVALWTRDRALDRRALHARFCLLAAFVLFNNWIHLLNHPEIPFPVALSLLAIGVGMVATLPVAIFASILAATMAVFVFTSGLADQPLTSRVEPGLALLGSIAFSVVLRAWLREYMAEMQRLRVETRRSARDRDAAHLRYREITEMATDLIAEVGEDGTVLYANPAHEAVFGYDPAALVGQKFSMFMGPDAVGRDRELLTGMLDRPVGPIRVDVVHSSGELRVIESSSRPYRAPDSSRRLVVTSHDVTARVHLETERARHRAELQELVTQRTEALQRSMEELQRRERLAAVGTLAAGVAHQINNPIGSVRMSAEYALGVETGSRDELAVLREALAVNVAEAKRCGEIVQNLLRFARDERGEIVEIEIEPLVERVANLCRSYATSRRSTVESELGDGVVLVAGNPVELEQLLINLIRNSIESRPSGVRVRVRLTRVDDEVLVDVIDDGHGLSESEVDKIFDPFFTTRLADGGTGLGLSVAHGIATAHHGTLTAQSRPEGGTRMRLTLPARNSRSASAAKPTASFRSPTA